MNIENIVMICLSIMFGLVQAAFWRWVTNVEKARDKDGEKIEKLEREVADFRAEIYQQYQSKSDSHRDSERIMQSLNEIKSELSKVNDKLDKKVDK